MTKYIDSLPDDKLTGRRAVFVEKYLVTLNKTQAVIEAGFSPLSASSQAVRLMKDPKIKQAIQRAMDERAARTNIDADWVLRNLKEVVERCLRKVPVKDKKGQPTGVWKFDSTGANRALELLGRHLRLWRDDLPPAPGDTIINVFQHNLTTRYEVNNFPGPPLDSPRVYEIPPPPEPELEAQEQGQD